jgi:UDP-3-O-[3-hydroxymyristoyl] glucosamine N-acyltransferase
VVIDAFSENGVDLGKNVKIGANTIINGSGSLKISGKGYAHGR